MYKMLIRRAKSTEPDQTAPKSSLARTGLIKPTLFA